MPIAKDNSAPRDPIPAGTHHAVCYAVVDLGTQRPNPGSKYPDKGPERKVMFLFELPEERKTYEYDGKQVERPMAISKEFTLSLHEKAALRKFLVSWRGRQFTSEELKGFDLKNVLGANCLLNVVHKDNGYEDISSVMRLPKSAEAKLAENELVNYDIENDEMPKTLPEWIRKKIAKAEEKLSAGNGRGHEPAPPHEDADEVPF